MSATSVPVRPTGTASLDVEVVDAENNPLGSQTLNQVQPPLVVPAAYQLKTGTSWNGNGQNQTVRWNYADGGSWSVSSYSSPGGNLKDPDIPPAGPGYTPPVVTSDRGETFAPNWQNANATFDNGNYFHTSIKTEVMIVSSEPKLAGGMALYLVSASAMQFVPLISFPDGGDDSFSSAHLAGGSLGNVPVSLEQLLINGQPLVGSFTDGDGTIWGETIISAPAGELVPLKLTTTNPTNNDYTFNVQATNVTVQSLTVVSNSATQIDATNWAVVKTPTNDYVIVQAVLSIAQMIGL